MLLGCRAHLDPELRAGFCEFLKMRLRIGQANVSHGGAYADIERGLAWILSEGTAKLNEKVVKKEEPVLFL